MKRNKFVSIFAIFAMVSAVHSSGFQYFQDIEFEFDGGENLLVVTSHEQQESIPSTFVDLEKEWMVFVGQEDCYLQKIRLKKLIAKMRKIFENGRLEATTGQEDDLVKKLVGSLLSRFNELFAVEEIQNRKHILGRRELAECANRTLWRTSSRRPSLQPTLDDYLKSYRENRTAWLLASSSLANEDAVGPVKRARRDVYLPKKINRSRRRRKLLSRKERRKQLKKRKFARLQADDSSASEASVQIDDSSYLASLKLLPKDAKGFIHYGDFYQESAAGSANPTTGVYDSSNHNNAPTNFVIPSSSFYDQTSADGIKESTFPGKVEQDIEFPKAIVKDGTVFYRHDIDTDSNGNEFTVPSFGTDAPVYPENLGKEIPGSLYQENELYAPFIPSIDYKDDHPSQRYPELFPDDSNPLNQQIGQNYANGFDFISDPISDQSEGTRDGMFSAIASAKRDSDGMSTIAVGKANPGGFFKAAAHGYDAEGTSHSQVEGHETGVSGVASMTVNRQTGEARVLVKSPFSSSAALSNTNKGSTISSAHIENRLLKENISDVGYVAKEDLLLGRDESEIDPNELLNEGKDNNVVPNFPDRNQHQTISQGGLQIGAGNASPESEIEQVVTQHFNENYPVLQLKTNQNRLPLIRVQHNQSQSSDSDFQLPKRGLSEEKATSQKEKDGAVGLVSFPYGEVGTPPGPGELLQQQNSKALSGSSPSIVDDSEEAFYNDYLDGLEEDPVFNRGHVPIKGEPSKSFHTNIYGDEERKPDSSTSSLLTPSPKSENPQSEKSKGAFTGPVSSSFNQVGHKDPNNLFDSEMLTHDFMPTMPTIMVPVDIPHEEPPMPVVPPGEEGSLQRLEPLNPDQPVINVLTLGRNDKSRKLYQRQGTNLQPGEKIPGAPGFIVPPGFRGKVVYGHSFPVEIDSRKTVEGYNTNVRVQPQYPPSDYPVYASVSGPEASKQFLPNQKPGIHITLGSVFPSSDGSHSGNSYGTHSQSGHHTYQRPQGLVGPQIPGTNLDYNKVTPSTGMGREENSWNRGINPRQTYSGNSWNTQWSQSWNNNNRYNGQSTSTNESCGYYTNNCKTAYGPYQMTKICKPIYIEVTCCC